MPAFDVKLFVSDDLDAALYVQGEGNAEWAVFGNFCYPYDCLRSALLYSLDSLRAAGWELEAWADEVLVGDLRRLYRASSGRSLSYIRGQLRGDI